MKSMTKRELKDSLKRYPKHCVIHIRNGVSVARYSLRPSFRHLFGVRVICILGKTCIYVAGVFQPKVDGQPWKQHEWLVL